VTPGQYLPPDPSKGDESTVGGYAAVHGRPAALEGRDGFSYSIEILSDATGEPARPVGAYLMFVQWSRLGAQKVEGHVESDFLAWGVTVDEAERAAGTMSLASAQSVLDGLLNARDGASTRRWWDAVEVKDDGAGAH
jgi:hypothetical protein